MKLKSDETSTDELTFGSVDERIKQATDPILRRVEDLCALLASRTEMESADNNASDLKRNLNPVAPHVTGTTNGTQSLLPRVSVRPNK